MVQLLAILNDWNIPTHFVILRCWIFDVPNASDAPIARTPSTQEAPEPLNAAQLLTESQATPPVPPYIIIISCQRAICAHIA
jgi:hypothetical protein